MFQEWLINYSQGFIRRGLIGTILWFIHIKFGIDILDIRRFLQFFSYGTFLTFSGIYIFKVKQCTKRLTLENLVVLLCLPSLIIFSYDEIGWKDFFYFLGLFINLFLLRKLLRIVKFNSSKQEKDIKNHQGLVQAVNQYFYSLFIWYNLISIPIALSHEALIFLAIPLNIIITVNVIGLAFSVRQVAWRTLIIYLPTIMVCILCLIFRGNAVIGQTICEQWQITTKCILTLILTSPYSVSSIHAFTYILAFLLNIVILMRTSSIIIKNSINYKIDKQDISNSLSPINIGKSFSFKYALLPFIASLIMYIVGMDWGRWFFMISMSYAFCFLSPSLLHLEIVGYRRNKWILEALSPIYYSYSKVINYLSAKSPLERFYPIYLIGLIYTLFMIKIPVIGMKPIDFYKGTLYQLFVFVNQHISKHAKLITEKL
ncbi:hypothetical protein [Rippkaea orientalis]|nr:hypothetical protein [Rippkaea orientalis]